MTDLRLAFEPVGRNGTGRLSAVMDGRLAWEDRLDLSRAEARDKAAAAVAKLSGAEREAIGAELLRLVEQLHTEQAKPTGGATPEIDVDAIARPELMHLAALSAITVPTLALDHGAPAGKWITYIRHADGRRERRPIPSAIDAGSERIFIHPQPAEPPITARPAWSSAARAAWLSGASAPNPAEVLERLVDQIDEYLEFQPDSAGGDVHTLALWAVLTYCYPAWPAVPYLSIGGPLGSGKSRVFEVLGQVVFRPMPSANLTAPTLFRTLHESGGTLLLDEAERLREKTPDAAELRSILLSGYKAGTPAKRLEPTADRKFRAMSFDVFGPKAIAGIASLPEALASRCIRLAMFRAEPDSPKPRRRIGDGAEAWQRLRDDLHALALEYGREWRELPARADVCPAMAGREYELWQPLLALAAWFDARGTLGLLGRMQNHALRVIGESAEDTLPDADEILLRLVADAVVNGFNHDLTPQILLARAIDRDAGTFGKWSAKGIANALRKYGITATKSHGVRCFRDVTPHTLIRIERAYGFDFGIPAEMKALCEAREVAFP